MQGGNRRMSHDQAPPLGSYRDFQRYLAAKETVDDRALNRVVWQMLVAAVADLERPRPLRVLEIGAGAGAMARRIWDWCLAEDIEYSGIDILPDNRARAEVDLHTWAKERRCQLVTTGSQFRLKQDERQMNLEWHTADVFEFAAGSIGQESWDLLIAHAFLDLVDTPSALPRILPLVSPGGLCYFTLNFDGQTMLEPTIDPDLDERVQALYHLSMDERMVDGRTSGDSCTGRHLLWQLPATGADLLAAGASDWVVHPLRKDYPADERYFLHFIVDTIYRELAGHPALDSEAFADWTRTRHCQIEQGAANLHRSSTGYPGSNAG